MVLTFDDLPYVAIDGDNAVAKLARVYREISGVLSAHRAPAVAFVNEGKLGDDGETKPGWFSAITPTGTLTSTRSASSHSRIRSCAGKLSRVD
jgi:hypothetical protein